MAPLSHVYRPTRLPLTRVSRCTSLHRLNSKWINILFFLTYRLVRAQATNTLYVNNNVMLTMNSTPVFVCGQWSNGAVHARITSSRIIQTVIHCPFLGSNTLSIDHPNAKRKDRPLSAFYLMLKQNILLCSVDH